MVFSFLVYFSGSSPKKIFARRPLRPSFRGRGVKMENSGHDLLVRFLGPYWPFQMGVTTAKSGWREALKKADEFARRAGFDQDEARGRLMAASIH
jgi:hypothetical protein